MYVDAGEMSQEASQPRRHSRRNLARLQHQRYAMEQEAWVRSKQRCWVQRRAPLTSLTGYGARTIADRREAHQDEAGSPRRWRRWNQATKEVPSISVLNKSGAVIEADMSKAPKN